MLPIMLAALALPALGTTIGVKEGTCPLGGGRVKIYEKIAANTQGGFDSDLAAYSTKGQFREYAVSTCPDNMLSLYGRDMGMDLDDDARARLEEGLPTWRARLSDPVDPPVWERYELAAHAYEALGRDPFFVAQIYVEASWTARDAAVGVYQGLNGPLHAQHLLEQGAAELDKDLDAATRRTLLYNLARVAERGGYPELRDRYLDAFQQSGGLTAAEEGALSRFRDMVTRVEPYYQDLAISHLEGGLRRDGIAMDDKIRATYLLADLLRRRGRPTEALGLFSLVLAEEQAPEDIREMALVLARELAGDEPIPLESMSPR